MEIKIDINEILRTHEVYEEGVRGEYSTATIKAVMKDFAEKLLELAATESHSVYGRKSIKNCINRVNFE